MKPHDRWEIDPERESRPVRVGKTWRFDWDLIIERWIKKLLKGLKK